MHAPMGRRWTAITELVLSADLNDPMSRACLAKAEHAHGHADFAVIYLQYAIRFIHANRSRNPGA